MQLRPRAGQQPPGPAGVGPRPQPGGFTGHLPLLKGSSEWPALEFMTRGEPPAPGTKFRAATARCPQHGGSTGRKGQRAAFPLSAETEHTARTLSCRHGKQPGTQPAPTTRQADSRFLSDCPGCPTTATLPSPGSVSSPGFLVFGLTPHRGPAGESCAGRANGQHTGQSSGPSPPLGSTPTPLLPSPLPSPVCWRQPRGGSEDSTAFIAWGPVLVCGPCG